MPELLVSDNVLDKRQFDDTEYFKEIVFEKIDFTKLLINNKEFYKCSFIKCNFENLLFSNSDFENCVFQECDLSLLRFNNTKLSDVDFKYCKLIGVDWTFASKPLKINFESCLLNNSNFYALTLGLIIVEDCSLQGVDFTKANLNKAKIVKCDLLNATFSDTILTYTDFSGSINYSINPNLNKLKKTIFSLPEALSLLSNFDIILK